MYSKQQIRSDVGNEMYSAFLLFEQKRMWTHDAAQIADGIFPPGGNWEKVKLRLCFPFQAATGSCRK